MTASAAELLQTAGPVAVGLRGYEQRPQQLAMAEAVQSAFADRRHLLVEAGTGVGKSFAYLVPALLAIQDGLRVVVSTYTIALQEQLIGKDLPFLCEQLGLDVRAVLGKGRGNYLCRRRLEAAGRRAETLFASQRELGQFRRIAQWASATSSGSRQDIAFAVSEAVWNRVRAEKGACDGRQCKFFDSCHFQKAREQMRKADLLVVNHALLLSDLALRLRQADAAAELLGSYDLLVVDEAHMLESVASEHFGSSVASAAVELLLRELYNPRNDRGVLALAEEAGAIDAVRAASSANEAFFSALADATGPAIAASGRISRPGVVANCLSPALVKLAGELTRMQQRIEDRAARLELRGYEQRAVEAADAVEELISQARDDCAYWRNLRTLRSGRRVSLACAPINVAPILKNVLFESVSSVVLTSATLTTGRAGMGGFDYVRSRLGLTEPRELALDSPFDFRRQVKLHVETRLGDPNRLEQFLPSAVEAMKHYIGKTEGRCFVLFTSWAMLRAAADSLAQFAEDESYELLVQGEALERSAMLNRFRQGGRCVLLGTVSFWQGVDVAGEALSNVIIAKLPFAVPNEPIVEARMDAIRDAGGNPFGEYQLPEAIIRFKQGLGRLIRSKRDTGIVVCLDHRLVTRPYGRLFIQALPDMEIIRDEAAGG